MRGAPVLTPSHVPERESRGAAVVTHATAALVLTLLASCAPATGETAGRSLTLRDPLGLVGDLEGDLRLLVLPAADGFDCDRASGIVSGPGGALPDDEGMVEGELVDITFAPDAGAMVQVPAGDYVILVRGRGTDPVSMRSGSIICSGCARDAIAAGETRTVDIELRAVVSEGACGDGVLSPDEQCEDGNVAPGDGCDATCRSEPFTVVRRGDGLTAAETAPAVAWAPGARLLVAYEAVDEVGGDIRAMLLDERGALFASPAALTGDLAIDPFAGLQGQPAAALGGGRYAVASEDFSGGSDGGDVRLVFLDTERRVIAPGVRVTVDRTGAQVAPSVALTTAGAALVVFENPGSSTGLGGRVFEAGQTMPAAGSELEIGGGVTAASEPVVAALGSSFLVAFVANGDVHYQRYDESGTAIDASARPIDPDGAGAQDQPAVAVLPAPDLRTLLVWRDGGNAVRGRLIDASGAPMSSAFAINTTAGPAASPAVAAGFDRYVVVWQAGAEIRGRTFDATGAPALNRERPVSTDDFVIASGAVAAPAVGAGGPTGEGRFVAVWQDMAVDPMGDIVGRLVPLP